MFLSPLLYGKGPHGSSSPRIQVTTPLAPGRSIKYFLSDLALQWDLIKENLLLSILISLLIFIPIFFFIFRWRYRSRGSQLIYHFSRAQSLSEESNTSVSPKWKSECQAESLKSFKAALRLCGVDTQGASTQLKAKILKMKGKLEIEMGLTLDAELSLRDGLREYGTIPSTSKAFSAAEVATFHFALCQLFMRENQMAKAIQHFEEALKADPKESFVANQADKRMADSLKAVIKQGPSKAQPAQQEDKSQEGTSTTTKVSKDSKEEKTKDSPPSQEETPKEEKKKSQSNSSKSSSNKKKD